MDDEYEKNSLIDGNLTNAEEESEESDCNSYFGCIMFYSVQLSSEEKIALKRLRRNVGVPYDEKNPHHEEKLKQLWAALNPEDPEVEDVSPKWKTLGFQADNPRTDFRGGGILSLDHMLWGAVNHYKEMKKMVNEARKIGYPLCAMLVNISHFITVYFSISKKGSIKVPHIPWLGLNRASNKVKKSFARLCMDPLERGDAELFTALACCAHISAAKIFLEEFDKKSGTIQERRRDAGSKLLLRFMEPMVYVRSQVDEILGANAIFDSPSSAFTAFTPSDNEWAIIETGLLERLGEYAESRRESVTN